MSFRACLALDEDDATTDLETLRRRRDRLAAEVERLEAERETEAARQRSRRAELVGLAVDALLAERGERERRRDLALWYLLAVAAPEMDRWWLERELRLWTDDLDEARELAQRRADPIRPSDQRRMEEELRDSLMSRLAFSTQEAGGIIEELRQADDPVARLEGLLAALRAFDELGDIAVLP